MRILLGNIHRMGHVVCLNKSEGAPVKRRKAQGAELIFRIIFMLGRVIAVNPGFLTVCSVGGPY